MKARISEIFESIQGEGLYVGESQLFVRFSGCNLACGYCDTKISSSREYEADELLEELKGFDKGYHSVSFTGGEPLMQEEFLKEVLPRVRALGTKNYLETNGTLPQALSEVIDLVDIVAMDLKFPSSTGLTGYWDEHFEFLKIASGKEVFLKAVICRATQDEDLREAIRFLKRFAKPPVLVLQPNSFEHGVALEKKVEEFRMRCVKEAIEVRVVPQVHKLLGVR